MKWKIVFFLVIAFSLGGCNDYVFVKYSSYFQASDIVNSYLVGIGIALICLFFYFYTWVIEPDEKKEKTPSVFKKYIGNLFLSAALAFCVYAYLWVQICGWASFVNRWVGTQQKVVLRGIVTEMHHASEHRSIDMMCYVVIEKEKTHNMVTLDLSYDHDNYQWKESFSKEMYKGCLGFYYLKRDEAK